jgi:hypothetical protein
LTAAGWAIAGDRADFAQRAGLPLLAGAVVLAVLVARWTIVKPTPDRSKAMIVVALLTGVVVLAAALQPTTVQDYCSYGGRSDLQVAGCVANVSRAYVETLDTNAARYARGDIGSCLADSGPYCSQRFIVYEWLGW